MMAKRHRTPGTSKPRILYVLPEIADELDEQTKNALAIRNAASTAGVCPDCGAEPELYRDPEHEGIFHAVFRHEPDCGAVPDEGAA